MILVWYGNGTSKREECGMGMGMRLRISQKSSVSA